MAIQENERYLLKIKALHYLYESEMTQAEIAEKLGISRVTLNHLIKEAKAEGMIRIEIIDTRNMLNVIRLEEEFQDLFGLKAVSVIDSQSQVQEELNLQIGQIAAKYLGRIIRSGMKIGVTWGKTVKRMSDSLADNKSVQNLELYTLLGALSDNVDFQPNVVAQSILRHYGSGRVRTIMAPYLCYSEVLCRQIKEDPEIAQILGTADELDVVLVGIGEQPFSGMHRLGEYPFDPEMIDDLVNNEAVGDICGNFFDINGKLREPKIRNRIVSVDLEKLRGKPMVIGMAGGSKKIRSILGALHGGYLDVLITDKRTAETVLMEEKRIRAERGKNIH